MFFIICYLFAGCIVLAVYTVIVQHKTSGVPYKEVIKDWLHPIVFVLLWPLDFIWGLIQLHRDPDDAKETVNEFGEKYYKC